MANLLLRSTKLVFVAILSFTLVNIYAHEGGGQLGNDDEFDVVVIDAGHGGKDPGAIGKRTREKDIALKLALQLGKKIESTYPDVKVVYTRKTDKFIELRNRAKIANDAKADLFISIHCNSTTSPNPNGSETFVLGLHKNDENLEVAKRENSVILLEDDYEHHYDFDPNSKVGHILLSMFQNDYLDKSIAFASKVEKYSVKSTQRKSRGVKQAGFVVLERTFAPSVLVEAGFLSNAKEEAYLMTDKGQKEVVNSIFRAFAEYKSDVDRSNQSSNKKYYSQSETITNNQAKSSNDAGSTDNTLPSYARSESKATQQTTPSTKPTSTPSKATQTPARQVVTETVVKKTLPSASEEVEYFIQLAAVSKKGGVSGGKWNKYNDKLLVRYESGLYKYQIGGYPSHATADQLRRELLSAFPGAFVVAYRGGEKLSLEQAFAASDK